MQVEAARVTSVGDSRADVELHTCLLWIPVQGCWAPDCWALWSALASSTPGDVCSQNKSHHCHWTVWSSFQGQDWDIQHHGKCCIPAARVRVVLGIMESLVYGAFALAASSLPAQHTGGVFQGNLKPKYPFRRLFPFPSRLDSCQWVVHNNKRWAVIFIAYWFLFWAALCSLHHHLTGLILECKKDASLTVKTTEGEEGSQVQDLIFPLPTKVFSSSCGGVWVWMWH